VLFKRAFEKSTHSSVNETLKIIGVIWSNEPDRLFVVLAILVFLAMYLLFSDFAKYIFMPVYNNIFLQILIGAQINSFEEIFFFSNLEI